MSNQPNPSNEQMENSEQRNADRVVATDTGRARASGYDHLRECLQGCPGGPEIYPIHTAGDAFCASAYVTGWFITELAKLPFVTAAGAVIFANVVVQAATSACRAHPQDTTIAACAALPYPVMGCTLHAALYSPAGALGGAAATEVLRCLAGGTDAGSSQSSTIEPEPVIPIANYPVQEGVGVIVQQGASSHGEPVGQSMTR